MREEIGSADEEGWNGWARNQARNTTNTSQERAQHSSRPFRCSVEPYVKEILKFLDIPLRQVSHYPYDVSYA